MAININWGQIIELLKSPNWTEILKVAVGPIIGASIALATLFLKDLSDRKKDVQSWYEKEYLIEGVDLLIAYFISLESLITNKQFTDSLKVDYLPLHSYEPLPGSIIAKMETLLGGRIFFVSASFIQHVALSKDSTKLLDGKAIEACFILAKQYNSILHELHSLLLTVKIKNKRSVYEIAQKPELQIIVDKMHNAHKAAAEKLGINYKTKENGRMEDNYYQLQAPAEEEIKDVVTNPKQQIHT